MKIKALLLMSLVAVCMGSASLLLAADTAADTTLVHASAAAESNSTPSLGGVPVPSAPVSAPSSNDKSQNDMSGDNDSDLKFPSTMSPQDIINKQSQIIKKQRAMLAGLSQRGGSFGGHYRQNNHDDDSYGKGPAFNMSDEWRREPGSHFDGQGCDGHGRDDRRDYRGGGMWGNGRGDDNHGYHGRAFIVDADEQSDCSNNSSGRGGPVGFGSPDRFMAGQFLHQFLGGSGNVRLNINLDDEQQADGNDVAAGGSDTPRVSVPGVTDVKPPALARDTSLSDDQQSAAPSAPTK